MKAIELIDLQRQLTFWPKTQSEKNSIVERIQMVFGASLVSFYSQLESGGFGISFSAQLSIEGLSIPGVVNFIRAKGSSEDRKNGAILTNISTMQGEGYWPFSKTIHYLSYFWLDDWKVESIRSGYAIAIGSTDRLSDLEEIALLGIARHLADLAKISELQATVELRSQFLSIASHELKTPLTSIYGILQLNERTLRLKAGQPTFPDQERYHHFLEMVIKQVERLNELIEGLLDVSRIQNGRFMIDPTDVDVAILLNDVIRNRLNLIAEEAGVTIHLETLPTLMARVDPVRFEEVINNLVMNAIRFSPEGGIVSVRLTSEKGAFRLTVRDQGPGISIEDHERIFRPFERAQRTARMGGLGLGLFISRQIALLHGGNVTLLESLPGKGNLFEAHFPSSRNPAAV